MQRNLSVHDHFQFLAANHRPKFRFEGTDQPAWRAWQGQLHPAVVASLGDMRGLTPGYSTQLGASDEPADIAPVYHPGWVSHGLVVSTAPELARAIDGLFAGRLFGAEMLAAMLDPVLVAESHPLFAQPAYGLGLMIDAAAPGIFAGHAGGGPGYSIGALHLTTASTRVTSVALVNRDDGVEGLRVASVLARLAAGIDSATLR